MLNLSALLLASQAAPSAERQMLDAFKAACERTGDLAAMKADAVTAGWRPMADSDHPRVDKLNRLGREAVGAGATMTGGSYRRAAGGRDLFLIVSRVEESSGVWGAGCRVYEFEAAAPLEAATLEAWMGRPPTGVEDPAPGLSRRLWEPGWRDGITLEITHVSAGNPLGERYGLQGNILMAQAIGGF